MKVVALAGGVGGARLAAGLAAVLPAGDLAIIVNTGDDFEHLGLRISPDLDTVCYTLAGLANPETGWGRVDETFQALENLVRLGGPGWFGLGDRDLGTHLERTRRLQAGQALSQVTRTFCQAWGIEPLVLPMSDQPVPTMVETAQGELAFQEYFVHQRCEPVVQGFRFQGVEQAQPASGVLAALAAADLVVICPSNPWVSIDPILAVPGIRPAVEAVRRSGAVLAVSPIIGGQAVKGPVVKMYAELGLQPSALAVAQHYGDLLSGFVLDRVDEALVGNVAQLGMPVLCVPTLMRSTDTRKLLAQEVLKFGITILEKESSGPHQEGLFHRRKDETQ
ncbi:MAG: 2-phospho-L-lactate transferase [Anaerolineales bacterium]|nr:2-phospho-L-lactate transferase [Anaerolineales bacterium]